MDLGVIISCCMSNPCPGWWEGGQKTNHKTNMDIETRCNDFTLLRNDHLVVCWQGKHTAPHGDERRQEQLSQEENNVLVRTSHERGTNTCVTCVWFLQIHNILQSQVHPTQKFTRSRWCCLKQTFFFKRMTVCTLQWRPTQTHTNTMHELFSVLISFQCSWECPESDQPLLPTPGHRKTLSLCDHTKGAVSVWVGKYHGLTRD